MREHFTPHILSACRENDLAALRRFSPWIQAKRISMRPHACSAKAFSGFFAAIALGHWEAAAILAPTLRPGLMLSYDCPDPIPLLRACLLRLPEAIRILAGSGHQLRKPYEFELAFRVCQQDIPTCESLVRCHEEIAEIFSLDLENASLAKRHPALKWALERRAAKEQAQAIQEALADDEPSAPTRAPRI